MSKDPPDTPLRGTMTCPTCGAAQDWSDACRRCRCELVLLRRVADTARAERQRCLQSFHAGRVSEALGHARRLVAISPDPSAVRLLAVCHLMLGNWSAATTLGRRNLDAAPAQAGDHRISMASP